MVFVMGEGILIFCAVMLASFVLLEERLGLVALAESIWPKVLLIAVVTQISLYFNDLYDLRTSEQGYDLATRLVRSIGITSIILAVIYFLVPEAVIGRWIFFGSILVLVLFLVSWRFLYALTLRKKLFAEKAVVVGGGELARDLLEAVQRSREVSYDIRSVIRQKQNGHGLLADLEGVPVHNGFESLCRIAEAEGASSIIVALDQKRGVLPYRQLLECKMKGINVVDGESFYERVTGKLLVEKITPSWLIFSDGFRKSAFSRINKRFVGLLMSSVMLILSSPFLLFTAIAIKLDSLGPVIYKQERVGEGEKIFHLYKFRSMVADAEKESGPVWAGEDDPRITRVGRIIRKLRIDELPQLWNVFKGDMSFVGPRPERPFFVEKLKEEIPYYNERFTVKPGVTGWAQIKYPYGASKQDALEKLKYELYYIKNMSFIFDLIIIFHTVKIVLLGRGSR
jgi:sugar transferase (PEP-CTERM system associated)